MFNGSININECTSTNEQSSRSWGLLTPWGAIGRYSPNLRRTAHLTWPLGGFLPSVCHDAEEQTHSHTHTNTHTHIHDSLTLDDINMLAA